MKIAKYELPEDLYYEEHHFWLRTEDDLLVMGLDDFGQNMAGDIVYVQFPIEGKRLKKGKSFAKLESGKWLGKVFAPVNGELAGVNEDLESDPSLINEDCYGKGWMYKIKPDDLSELDELIHSPEEVEKWVLADIEKYTEESTE